MIEPTDTHQQLVRNAETEKTTGAEPLKEFSPTEEWRAEFQEQATRGNLDKLYRIAKARLGAYAGKGRHVDDADVEDVVSAVLVDTLSGTLTWNPARHDLYAHLKDAIKFRVRNEAKSTRKRKKHDPLEEDERNESLAPQIAAGAIVPTVTTPDERDEQLGRLADSALTDLRALAVRDVDVTKLIEALANRITDRDELIRVTGMNLSKYTNAWRRLGRLVNQLPVQLRDEAWPHSSKEPHVQDEQEHRCSRRARGCRSVGGRGKRAPDAAEPRGGEAVSGARKRQARRDAARRTGAQRGREGRAPTDPRVAARAATRALLAVLEALKQTTPTLGFAHRDLAEVTDDDLRTMIEDAEWSMGKVS